MDKRIINDVPWVVIENGSPKMYDSNGNRIKGIKMARLRIEVGCLPTIMVKAIVNVVDSEEEMMQAIKSFGT